MCLTYCLIYYLNISYVLFVGCDQFNFIYDAVIIIEVQFLRDLAPCLTIMVYELVSISKDTQMIECSFFTIRNVHYLTFCWISPVVTFWSNFFYINMFKENLIRRKAHRIVKYLKLKQINLSIELRELVLDKVKFKNKALLKETLIIDGL